MPDYDSPWKEMLDGYFPAFMAFFFPEAHADIDWTRGYESLDTELQQIVRDAALGTRLADKLMKVWRRDGTEQIVLVHTEIQGTQEADFAKRIYVYNYRLFDRYDRPVVSLAVLGDASPRWRPTRYEQNLWGCRVGIEFPVVKLRDYAAHWEALEASDNPFATVVMAHLQAQATRRDPEGRLQAELVQLERGRQMPYITSIERMGMEKGRQQGLQQGEVIVLKRLLTRRFGPLPAWAEQRLEQASPPELESWAEQVLEAQRLEDVLGPAPAN